jgi:hypothetical protein
MLDDKPRLIERRYKSFYAAADIVVYRSVMRVYWFDWEVSCVSSDAG